MDEPGRIIGFSKPVIGDLIWQGISILTVLATGILCIVLLVLFIRLSLLGIKALKLYIKNNS